MTPTPIPSPNFISSLLPGLQTPDLNTTWQVVTAIVIFVLGLVASALFYRRQAEKKAMRIDWISVNSLVSVAEQSKSDIEVRYKGIPIREASVIGVQLTNIGNTDILEADFATHPIILSFVPQLKILSNSSGPLPYGLTLHTEFDNDPSRNFLLIYPFLFRKRESITISVVVENSIKVPTKPYEVSDRMINVPLIKGYDGKPNARYRSMFSTWSTIGFFVAAAGVVLVTWGPQNIKLLGLLMFIAGGAAYGLMFVMSAWTTTSWTHKQ